MSHKSTLLYRKNAKPFSYLLQEVKIFYTHFVFFIITIFKQYKLFNNYDI